MAEGGEVSLSELLRDRSPRSRFISDESIFAGRDTPDKQFEVEEETKGHSFSLFRQHRRPRPLCASVDLIGLRDDDDDDDARAIYGSVQSPTFGFKPRFDDESFYEKDVAENLNIMDMDDLLLPKLLDPPCSEMSDIPCDMNRRLGLDMGKIEEWHEPVPAFSTAMIDLMTASDTPSKHEFSFMVPERSDSGDNLDMIVDDKADFSVIKPANGTAEKPKKKS